MNEQERKANTYADALIDRLRNAGSDAEIVAICKETEKAVKRLQDIKSPRFHHIVNLVQLRRKDFARAKHKAQQAQQELWK